MNVPAALARDNVSRKNWLRAERRTSGALRRLANSVPAVRDDPAGVFLIAQFVIARAVFSFFRSIKKFTAARIHRLIHRICG
ncbi:MAG: hypothetical protein ACYC7B_01530 [Burkholderiales bacterium]